MSKEYADYLSSLKNYRDTNNQLQTKFNEGIEKGIKKGIKKGIEAGIKKGIKIEEERSNQKLQNKTFEIARALLDVLDNEMIAVKTGLTLEEVEKLRN